MSLPSSDPSNNEPSFELLLLELLLFLLVGGLEYVCLMPLDLAESTDG